jgi:hypothetical protein
MPSGRDQLRFVGDLIHGDKANAESARGPQFAALITGGDTAETVEVTSVLAGFFCLPRAFGLFDLLAVAEDTVIVDDKGIVAHVKAHRSGTRGIVSILNEFMRERAVSL